MCDKFFVTDVISLKCKWTIKWKGKCVSNKPRICINYVIYNLADPLRPESLAYNGPIYSSALSSSYDGRRLLLNPQVLFLSDVPKIDAFKTKKKSFQTRHDEKCEHNLTSSWLLSLNVALILKFFADLLFKPSRIQDYYCHDFKK